MKKSYDKENGRSMIEMLGVLAIIGVLSVGGIAGYSKAMYRYRLNKTIEEITQIAGNVRAFFAPQKSYAGVSSSESDDTGRILLKKAKLVPEDMWEINGYGATIKHPFDGGFHIYPTAKVWNNTCRGICRIQALTIELLNLPESACIDLLTQGWSNAGVNLIGILNYGNPTFGYKHAYVIPPVSIDHAVKICEVSATNASGVHSIYFYFDIDVTKGDAVTYINNTLTTLNGS